MPMSFTCARCHKTYPTFREVLECAMLHLSPAELISLLLQDYQPFPVAWPRLN